MPYSLYLSNEILKSAGLTETEKKHFSALLQLQITDPEKYKFSHMERNMFNTCLRRISDYFLSLQKQGGKKS